MTAVPELYILRHGETVWNAEGRLQGRADSPLTATGRAQAARQGALLAAAGVGNLPLRASPSPRALTTAEIALPGRPILLDARLMEVDLGDWTGALIADLAAARPDIATAADAHHWKFGAPGGETLEAMAARCRAVLDDLDGPAILVTHGLTSRVLRCLALGLPPHALADLPGGQGVIHHIRDGQARLIA